MEKNNSIIGHIFAILCVFIWGTSFLISKNLMSTLSAVQLICLRFFIAYITLWILHPKWRFNWKEEIKFLIISLFANTLYFLAENTALKLTQTSNVSILVTTAPIFTALILQFGKSAAKISSQQVFGFIIALVGVVLVVLNGVFNLQLSPKGDLLALAAALSWAIYGILVRDYSAKFNSFFITRKLMFYGLITSMPILMAEGAPLDAEALLSTTKILSLLYLGVVCSAACYIMWNRSIRDIGVLKANIYIYAIPMVTLIVGAIFMDETVTLLGAAGIVLVIFGMAISNITKKGNKA